MMLGQAPTAATAPQGRVRQIAERGIAAAILLACGLFWLAVALRVATPLVLADEYVYIVRGVALDRLRGLETIAPSIPNVGNYLYLRLVNLASRGPAPLDLVMKVFNVACVVAAVHLLGRLVLTKAAVWRSAALFALTAFLPLGSYVAYVMPESLYFLVFVAIFALLMSAADRAPLRLWAMVAALIGVLTLVKAHGLFVLIALLAATLAWSVGAERRGLAWGLRRCGAALAGFGLAVWLGMAFLGLQKTGGDFVGSFYWNMVKGGVSARTQVAIAAQLAATYAAAVLMLLAPSLSFIGAGVLAHRRHAGSDPRPGDWLALVGLFLLLLLGVITVAVAFILYAEPARVQFRYLSFTFPCVLALAWIWGRAEPSLDSRAFRGLAAALWLCGACYFLVRLPGLRPLAADAPELFFAYYATEFGRFGLGSSVGFVTAGVICVCAGAMLHPKIRWFDAQMVALAVLVPIADFNAVRWQGLWSASQAPLRAVGDLARTACGPGRTDIVAVRPPDDSAQVYTALSRIGREVPLDVDPNAGLETLGISSGGCVITSLDMDAALGLPLAHARDLSLYRSAGPWRVVSDIAFDHGKAKAMLGNGWSGPEVAGVWTDGHKATLHLDPTLAKASGAVVEISAAAFDAVPGRGQWVEVSLDGRPLARWLVHDGLYEVRMPSGPSAHPPFDLQFSLPDAQAPASIFPGVADRRLLGVSLRRVRILRPRSADGG
jgi:hypothetical protein